MARLIVFVIPGNLLGAGLVQPGFATLQSQAPLGTAGTCCRPVVSNSMHICPLAGR